LGAGIERGWIPLGRAADWKVADLPRLDALAPRRAGFLRKSLLQRRFEALLEVILTALFVAWWTGLVPAPWWRHLADSGMVLQPASIWAALYWPLLAWAGVQLVSSLIGLLRPEWVRARAALEIVCGLAGLTLAVVLWRAGRLVVVGPEGVSGLNGGQFGLQTALDLSFHLTAAVMIVVLTIKIAVELWRLFRGPGPGVPEAA
jgi:hypothetical protein